MHSDLPKITLELVGDEVLHGGITVPHLNGVPILPGAVIEERCELRAELNGLVYPSHDTWCNCGAVAVAAIGWGSYGGSNGMNGPMLKAVVTQFQWAPPISPTAELWLDRHVQPDEICHLGMSQTNWRARVIEPLPTKPLRDSEREWLEKQLDGPTGVYVLPDIGHPSQAFYRGWEMALFGAGVNEDYIGISGHYKPDYPYRQKFIVGSTLIAPLVDTILTPYQGLQAFSVLISGDERKAVDRHTSQIANRHELAAVEFGGWTAYPIVHFGMVELEDCRLALVCPDMDQFYLFNRQAGVTFGPIGSYWAVRLPLR